MLLSHLFGASLNGDPNFLANCLPQDFIMLQLDEYSPVLYRLV